MKNSWGTPIPQNQRRDSAQVAAAVCAAAASVSKACCEADAAAANAAIESLGEKADGGDDGGLADARTTLFLRETILAPLRSATRGLLARVWGDDDGDPLGTTF